MMFSSFCSAQTDIDEISLLGTTWILEDNEELLALNEADRENGLQNTVFNTCNLHKIVFNEEYKMTSDSRFWSMGTLFSKIKDVYEERCYIQDYYFTNKSQVYPILHIVSKSNWMSHFVNLRFKVISFSKDEMILEMFYKNMRLVYHNENSINSVKSHFQNDKNDKKIYDLNGISKKKLTKGINIIKDNKGVKKQYKIQ